MPSFHPLEVVEVTPLCDDAVAVGFAVPEPLRSTFAFAAGQHLTLRRTVAGVEHRRSYSVCAPAGAAPRVGVREVPGGVLSSWLVRDVRPGDVVDVAPPSGRFALSPDRADAVGRHVLIGAGSGITPLLSLAATLLAATGARVSLLYGNRTTASVMFADELADLKDRWPARFDVTHVLSREPRSADLLSGRLDATRLRRLLEDVVPVAGADVWLCGPVGLIEVAREVLADVGVPPHRVHAELFFVDQPPPPPVRRDPSSGIGAGVTSRVTLTVDGRSTTADLPVDRPVLDSAASTRADLPFACKGGVCGTCRARVVDGEVDLRRNYALDDDELARGFVLACQSYPLTPEVALDFDA